MKKIHPATVGCALASCVGFAFAAVSTSDFVAHLDRQVHGIHCSFLPGAAADTSGASGCHATLMSPYSSVFREDIWGGIPVALPAMPVFAFILLACLFLAVTGRQRERAATGLLLLGTSVPLLTSAVMAYLSLEKLDAACKLCIGIYASSTVCFLSALALKMSAGRTNGSVEEPLSFGALTSAVGAAILFVLVPVGAYAKMAPDFSNYIGSCGSLPHPNHEPSVLVPLGPQNGRTKMLEVLDPLCPSCRGFEERWKAMGHESEVDRRILLFPLDQECNWMIDRSLHPGACSVSEAMMCTEDPEMVLKWAFEHQQEILAAAEADPKEAVRLVKRAFPTLASCIGSAKAKAKVNQSLRWAVKNQLPIVTPQVFVEGWRLCGEDTDLGLDYALPRLMDKARSTPLPKSEDVEDESPRPEVRAAKSERSKKITSKARDITSAQGTSDERGELTKDSPDEPAPETRTADAKPEGDSPAAKQPAEEPPQADAAKSSSAPPPPAAPAPEEKPSAAAPPPSDEAKEVQP